MDEARFPFLPSPFDPRNRGSREDPGPYAEGFSEEEDEPDCPLFAICEELADLYSYYRKEGENPYASRIAIEAAIVEEYGLAPDRAAGLLDLARETRHLRRHGSYRRAIAEIGWLIAFVTEGWTGEGEN